MATRHVAERPVGTVIQSGGRPNGGGPAHDCTLQSRCRPIVAPCRGNRAHQLLVKGARRQDPALLRHWAGQQRGK